MPPTSYERPSSLHFCFPPTNAQLLPAATDSRQGKEATIRGMQFVRTLQELGLATDGSEGLQFDPIDREGVKYEATDDTDCDAPTYSSGDVEDFESYFIFEDEVEKHPQKKCNGADYNQIYGGVMYWNTADYAGIDYSRPPSLSSEDSSWARQEADLNVVMDDIISLPQLSAHVYNATREPTRVKCPPSPVVLYVPLASPPPPPCDVGFRKQRHFLTIRSGSSSPRHWGISSWPSEEEMDCDDSHVSSGLTWRSKCLRGTPPMHLLSGALLPHRLIAIQSTSEQEHPDIALSQQSVALQNNPALQASLDTAEFVLGTVMDAVVSQGMIPLREKSLQLICESKGHWRHVDRHWSLTQKYAPKTFKKLVGQNLVAQNRPCGVCSLCIAQRISKSSDVKEIISVGSLCLESISRLLDNVVLSSSTSHYRLVIMDDCDTLTSKAWDAISKILDSIPRHVVFILVTTSLDQLPHTIVTRCQKFFFPKLKGVDIVLKLQAIAVQKGLEIDKDALKLIVSKSDESLWDAEMTLDQFSLLGKRISLPLAQELVGLIPDEKLVDLLDLALFADTVNTGKCLRELMEESVDPLSLMLQLATLITDILAGSYKLPEKKA
eukprot:Gb_40078 [translate_table: standard]